MVAGMARLRAMSNSGLDSFNCAMFCLARMFFKATNNSNGVSTLGQGADGSYNLSQMQDVLNKLDELINALRR